MLNGQQLPCRVVVQQAHEQLHTWLPLALLAAIALRADKPCLRGKAMLGSQQSCVCGHAASQYA